MSVSHGRGGALTQPLLYVILRHGMQEKGTQGHLEHEIHITVAHNYIFPAHKIRQSEFENGPKNERGEGCEEREVPAEQFAVCHEEGARGEAHDEGKGKKGIEATLHTHVSLYVIAVEKSKE